MMFDWGSRQRLGPPPKIHSAPGVLGMLLLGSLVLTGCDSSSMKSPTIQQLAMRQRSFQAMKPSATPQESAQDSKPLRPAIQPSQPPQGVPPKGSPGPSAADTSELAEPKPVPPVAEVPAKATEPLKPANPFSALFGAEHPHAMFQKLAMADELLAKPRNPFENLLLAVLKPTTPAVSGTPSDVLPPVQAPPLPSEPVVMASTPQWTLTGVVDSTDTPMAMLALGDERARLVTRGDVVSDGMNRYRVSTIQRDRVVLTPQQKGAKAVTLSLPDIVGFRPSKDSGSSSTEGGSSPPSARDLQTPESPAPMRATPGGAIRLGPLPPQLSNASMPTLPPAGPGGGQ